MTFRFSAPAARAVAVTGSVQGAMKRDSAGVWSLTLGPLPPNIYNYAFVFDGAHVADPANPWNHNGSESLLLVPARDGDAPRPWEPTLQPHGIVQINYYTSAAMPGRLRRCHVYLPPGYDGSATRTYPTLYLLHGNGDNDASWTGTGRANFLLDSMLAAGVVQPMVVVMPDGGSIDTMPTSTFVDDVLHNLIPFVEHQYKIRPDANGRAVAGLSMGGGHALHLALDTPGNFGAVGIWSCGWKDWQKTSMPALLPNLSHSQADYNSVKIIDLACGRSDGLLPLTESLDAWLARCGTPHTLETTEGAHAWSVWRDDLLRFAPRLFRQ